MPFPGFCLPLNLPASFTGLTGAAAGLGCNDSHPASSLPRWPSPFGSLGLASELGPCVGAFLIHGSQELLLEIKLLTLSLPHLPLMSEFQFHKAQVSSYGTPDIQ